MKKHTFIILITLLYSFLCYSQQDVIVLVDISKSIQQSHFTEARKVVKNILVGESIQNADFTLRPFLNTTLKVGNGNPLLGSGNKLLIIPFGEPRFWEVNYNFEEATNFDSFFETNYPNSVTDNKTYLELAKIKAAYTAKKNGVDNYILILVSDNINDDYGPEGKTNYTAYQSNAVSNYKTVSNPYLEIKQSEITYRYDPSYKIILHTVNIKDWKPYTAPTNNTNPVVPNDFNIKSTCELKFTSYANGKKDKETVVKSKSVTFRWSGNNKPLDTNYKISIASTTGNRENNISKSGLTSNSYNVNLEDDTYRVSITAEGCKSDVTYIKITSSSGGGSIFLILLILAIIGGVAYYLHKKNQDKKMEETQFRDSSADAEINYEDTNTTNNELDGF